MRKYQIGVAAVLLLGLLAAGVFAFGFRGDPAVAAAIKADDYAAFTNALTKDNVTRTISQSQFEQMVNRTNQRTAGLDALKNNDYAAWTASGHNETQSEFTTMAQLYNARQKVQQSIASNDFASWKQAMSDLLQLQSDGLTQENFDKIVARQNAPHKGGFGRGFGRFGFQHPGK